VGCGEAVRLSTARLYSVGCTLFMISVGAVGVSVWNTAVSVEVTVDVLLDIFSIKFSKGELRVTYTVAGVTVVTK
jgi:hypothetical protein